MARRPRRGCAAWRPAPDDRADRRQWTRAAARRAGSPRLLAPRARGRRGDRYDSGGVHGQPHAHRCPHAHRGRDLDDATVITHDAMDDGEAEAGPPLERAAVRLKDAVELLGWNAAPFVLHADHHLVLRRGMVGLDREEQAAAVGHRAQAVGGNVPDDLTDLVLVRLVPDGRRRYLDVD